MSTNLNCLLEAILFYKGEPVKVAKLAEWLQVSSETIIETASKLKSQLEERGLILVQGDEELSLGTAPEASGLIENITKEELNKNLGRAALETLSIVVYKGPVARAEIDFIRGVNSSYILRHLLVRGLVNRTPNPEPKGGFLYQASLELRSYLGVGDLKDLPEWNEVKNKLESFLSYEPNN